MKKSFKYTLEEPIEVAIHGEFVSSADVEVFSPRKQDRNNALIFESHLKRALLEFASIAGNIQSPEDSSPSKSETATENTEDSEFDSVRTYVMSGATPESLKSMVHLLGEMLTGGNKENPQATVGGQKFTKPLYDDLGFKDLREILVRYASVFLS